MIVWYKNIIDIDNDNITMNVSDSVATATGTPNFVRDRKNSTGWATTGSSDLATCTFAAESSQEETFDTIILIGHNFKNFTIQRFNGTIYEDFSPAINVTNNTATSTKYSVASNSTTSVKITITGTMTADDDKFLAQMIITNQLYDFGTTNQMEMDIVLDRDKKLTKTVSGKYHVARKPGGLSAKISKKNITTAAALAALKAIYESNFGFLFSFSGFDESLFTKTTAQFGYRKQDIFLMKAKTELESNYNDSYFNRGQDHKIDLIEII